MDDSVDVEKALASAPLLADLDPSIIKRLAEQGVRRVYQPGVWIIQQDDPASALYVILRGRARAEKDGELDRDRKSTRLNSSHWITSRMPSSA